MAAGNGYPIPADWVMTCPPGDPIFQQCASTAHDGVFWRSTRGVEFCEPINVAFKILGLCKSPSNLDGNISQCYEVQIVEPALAEIYLTPCHDEHRMIDQIAILVIPSDFRTMQQTIVRASETGNICCAIASRVQWENEVRGSPTPPPPPPPHCDSLLLRVHATLGTGLCARVTPVLCARMTLGGKSNEKLLLCVLVTPKCVRG